MKTKETKPTRPGSPTPCKQALIRECDESRLNKLPSTRIFIAAENGRLEVLELVALFFLKTITFRMLTTGSEISGDAFLRKGHCSQGT